MANHPSRPSSVRLELEHLESRDAPAILNAPYVVSNNIVSDPSSAVNAAGTRVVVWAQANGALDSDIWAQRFFANGDKNGAPIRVTSTTDAETEPDVAIDGAGNFYVSYTRVNQRANNSQIEVRLFSPAGLLRQATVIPLTSTFVKQVDSHVACSAAGDAVVSYTESLIVGDKNVMARMFLPNSLNFRRSIFVANSTLVEADSDIARVGVNQALTVPSFVIAYSINGTDVVARRYNANGDLLNPNNPLLQVAVGPLNDFNPSIAVNAPVPGVVPLKFAVSWQRQTSFFSGNDIFARSFDGAGVFGPIRGIATSATDDTDPTVAIRNNGRIVVAYTSLPPGVFNFSFNAAEIDDTLLAPLPRIQVIAFGGYSAFAGFSTLAVNPAAADGGYFVAYTVQSTLPNVGILLAQVRRFA